ncbi:F-box only protein 7 isoform 1 (Predicted) [Elysia marginata]|uniref:F-box only protein 7 isoform 1 (Predicted) n=1 Tax=Elysia marginata TaxID=1093978 RepID=A0AAV4F8L3_9GAST|nr:F-box only protein 7 isoform 1 (Predicted) [Elysia marginata]
MPTGWKQLGYYKCMYHLPFPGREPGECSIAGVPMASSLIVHGLARSDGSFKTEHVQLKPSDFVTNLSGNVPSVYVGLDRLSRQFKDTVCLPLQNELATAIDKLMRNVTIDKHQGIQWAITSMLEDLDYADDLGL